MLKLHPNLNKLNEDYSIIRKSVIELEIDGVIHFLDTLWCSNCDGTGKHLYGSMQGHAYTKSEFTEDPDLLSDMLNGKYDVTCEDCSGEGFVMTLIDDDHNKDLIEELETSAIAKAEYMSEIRSEQMMLGEY